MKSIRWVLANFEEMVCVALFTFIFGLLLTHVVLRYVFGAPIAWSEEVARYAFIWITFLGASVVLKHREHVSVEYFVTFLPIKARVYLKLAIDISIFIFLILIADVGMDLVRRTATIETAALGWSWSYVYGALPVGCYFMLITLSRLIWQDVCQIRQGNYEQVTTVAAGLETGVPHK